MRPLFKHLVVILVIILAYVSGLGATINKAISDLRFKVITSEASGDIVLVAIDPKSLQGINRWPWPRAHHADLVAKLQQAGVAEIAFDIDFSAKTNEENDTAFLKALESAGGSIILPAFKQVQIVNGKATIVNSLPLKEFQNQAWLASVNIVPSRNGQIETMAYGHAINSEFIPSLASLLSETYKPKAKDFYINFGIKARTVPVFSYIDVLEGRINEKLLKGKKVVIGATATELGDYLYVPSQGMIAGPILQILAAETILQNKQLHSSSPIILFAGLFIIAGLILMAPKNVRLFEKVCFLLMISIASETIAVLTQPHTNIILDTSLWHIAIIGYCILALVEELDLRKVITNITKIELANTQRMFKQVFDNSFSGTIITNQEGTIEAASKSAKELLRIKPDQKLIGKDFRTILPTEIVIAATNLFAQADKPDRSTHFASQTQVHQENGDEITLEFILTLTTLKENSENEEFNKHVIAFSFQDITARHKAERAQQEAILAAKQSNKAKNDFLSNMSHELRTPLNSIIGFADILQKGGDHVTPSVQKEYIDVIQTSGNDLLKIINDILTLTKIESNSLTINECQCDPLTLIDNAIETTSNKFKDEQLNIVVEHRDNIPDLYVDKNLIQQTFEELLSNAVKFSPLNSEINLQLSLDENDELTICVKDQGTGISQSEIEKIFSPFYQVESAKNRSYEGTGLGLSKVNAFAKLHNATLKIDTRLGMGVTVFLTFPKERTLAPKQDLVVIENLDFPHKKSA